MRTDDTPQKPGSLWELWEQAEPSVPNEKTQTTFGETTDAAPPAARFSRPRSPTQWRKIFRHLNGGEPYSEKSWQNLRKGVLAPYLRKHRRYAFSVRLNCPSLPADFDDAAD